MSYVSTRSSHYKRSNAPEMERNVHPRTDPGVNARVDTTEATWSGPLTAR
eukprot:CAMPEP_0198735238 /NCGR_PEP_ID=MMETSP1475-20131203/58086_1 /TAXON_ID= ORGANISM="Unidentified sp., Strain CCMP1999" /NCGR_SAMPLE_ID=MMETSP1475 /ASSEMBLY_ACC=CAM_ASM_001111 /LENGTH=49 /DNA_ID= /DNA_START= /DNA_END= /DNA_ORIENTATION=